MKGSHAHAQNAPIEWFLSTTGLEVVYEAAEQDLLVAYPVIDIHVRKKVWPPRIPLWLLLRLLYIQNIAYISPQEVVHIILSLGPDTGKRVEINEMKAVSY